jgi:O-antigen ligase
LLTPASESYRQTKLLLTVFGSLTVLSLLTGIAGGWYFLAGIPLALLAGYVAVVDFRKLFFLMFAIIPLSVEVWLPNGVVTELPTEILMILLTGIYFLYVLREGNNLGSGFVRHPITLLLLLHLFWMFFTAITSQDVIVSIKFFLAKTWFVVPCYFLAGSMLKTEQDFRTLTWCVLLPLVFTIIYVLIRHSTYGFTFKDVNLVMDPFYRNKVAYACLTALFLPFLWFARKWFRRYTWQWWVMAALVVLFFVAIRFSYTRAAFVVIAMAVGAYYVIQWRLMKYVLAVSAVFAVVALTKELRNNAYLDLRPQYERAITHEKFDNLLEATAKGEDVSTMERVYRWVAAGHMVADKPWLGFGAGTFTRFYQAYAVTAFTTYVSDNQEGSGLHCYYLMTLVEQGVPGAFIFIALVFFVLLKGEIIYHRTTDPARRRIVMTVMLTTVIIDALLLVNDMVETDKVGSFFFLCMAVLVNMDLETKKAE